MQAGWSVGGLECFHRKKVSSWNNIVTRVHSFSAWATMGMAPRGDPGEVNSSLDQRQPTAVTPAFVFASSSAAAAAGREMKRITRSPATFPPPHPHLPSGGETALL